MVLAFKVFEVIEPRDLGILASKLRDVAIIEEAEIDGRTVETGIAVRELQLEEDKLRGVFEESFVATFRYRDEYFKVPISVETPFEFYVHGDRVFLILEAKKQRANRLAGFVGEIVSAKKGSVVEAELSHETLKAMYESNPEGTKVIFFDNVRLPGIEKLSLYGEQLANTELYQKYLQLGTIWYIVYETEEGIVIGVTRNCVVTVFSRVDPETALEIIRERIIPKTLPLPGREEE
ncbi:MAG: hypothetical protein DRJ55_00965 [Thermoprotei archaeon]|nr:MAG: hypothetical protein DRJ55_00965 [Thermoprotei archaeon]